MILDHTIEYYQTYIAVGLQRGLPIVLSYYLGRFCFIHWFRYHDRRERDRATARARDNAIARLSNRGTSSVRGR